MTKYWIKFHKDLMIFQSRITNRQEGHDHAIKEGFKEVTEVYYISLSKLILSHIEPSQDSPF